MRNFFKNIFSKKQKNDLNVDLKQFEQKVVVDNIKILANSIKQLTSEICIIKNAVLNQNKILTDLTSLMNEIIVIDDDMSETVCLEDDPEEFK
jgi:hypothetical protein